MVLGKETMHHPAPVRNFSLTRVVGATEKDFGGRYGFPVFLGFCVDHRPGKLFLMPDMFSK